MSAHVLAARGIELRYSEGPVPVLTGLDLDLQPAEVIVILGPSGVGKSSLLRVLGGLQMPSSGTVAMRGEPLRSVDPRVASRFRIRACCLGCPWRRMSPSGSTSNTSRNFRGTNGWHGSRRPSQRSAFPMRGIFIRPRCPAGWRNALPLPAASPASRTSCYSTSRLARSMK